MKRTDDGRLKSPRTTAFRLRSFPVHLLARENARKKSSNTVSTSHPLGWSDGISKKVRSLITQVSNKLFSNVAVFVMDTFLQHSLNKHLFHT